MPDSRTPILFMEDVLEIRRLAAAFFKREGFEVVEAANVREAVEAVREFPDLRMVMSDLQTRAGTARDLHQEVGAIIQERKGLFVVMTGSSFDEPRLAAYGAYFREHRVHVIHKPLRWLEEVVPYMVRFRDQMVAV